MIFTGEKKNRLKRRIIAMVLCICMVMALSGTSGFGLYAAGENTGVATAGDADETSKVSNTPAASGNIGMKSLMRSRGYSSW